MHHRRSRTELPSFNLLLFLLLQTTFPRLAVVALKRRRMQGLSAESCHTVAMRAGEWFSHQLLQADTVCSWGLPVALTLYYLH